MKKKLYFDVCTLCRPFDDQNKMRIHLETDAFYLILQNIINGKFEMIVSPVHFKEIEAIKDMRERVEILAIIKNYGVIPVYDLTKARNRAEYLYSSKFGVADAAHIAFAEQSSDYFISCDDKLLQKSKRIKINVSTANPVNFCIKEDIK